MNQSYTRAERAHLEAVKELPCSICGQPGPSEAHHLKQKNAYSVVALCPDCHRGPQNGIHGRRAMWLINHMDELDALIVTYKRLMGIEK